MQVSVPIEVVFILSSLAVVMVIFLVLLCYINKRFADLYREVERRYTENTDSNNKHIVSVISGNHNKVE